MINSIVSVNTGRQPENLVQGSRRDVKNSEASVEKTVASSATSNTSAQETPTKPAGSETSLKLQAAVIKLNDHNQNLSRNLSFSIDESTGNTIIRVYDSETHELIREIPSEETIRIAASIETQHKEIFLKGQQA